ncbi:Succinate dehydrogenase cytochrome b558 subunit [Geobacillus sp. BCO2]|nr:Succinate dehydrogenase cytochrome b558 subunit [Geobacillus sp. BCO2]
MAGNREFYYRRLHSLLGVIPVGVFLVQHLVVNHFATRGPEAFNRAAAFMENLPFRYFLEIFCYFSSVVVPRCIRHLYRVYSQIQHSPVRLFSQLDVHASADHRHHYIDFCRLACV